LFDLKILKFEMKIILKVNFYDIIKKIKIYNNLNNWYLQIKFNYFYGYNSKVI